MDNKRPIERRSFLKLTAATAAGTFLSTKLPAQQQSELAINGKMIYRNLGRTGYKLPIVSMGVMRADNPDLVKAALKAGMLHLDTAHGYQEGKNETMLGKILKDYKREDYTIATKIAMPKDKGLFTEEATKEAFFEKLAISLDRLKINYVDILYSHAISKRETVLHPEILDALKTAKAEGKTKFIGVSTHRNEPEVIDAAIEAKVYDVVLVAYNFTQDHHVEVNKALKRAHDAGLGTVVMKTMAGGYLDKEHQRPVNAVAALKWALQEDYIHTSIPGFSNFEEMDECLSVMKNLKIKRREAKDLEIDNEEGSLYCSGCQDCTKQCRAQIEAIPDLMRTYMYAYGYKDLKLARQTIDSLNLPTKLCGDCSECTVNCRKGFNVKEKIADIVRIKDIPTDFLM